MKYATYLWAFCLLGLMGCQPKEQTPEQFTESLPQVYPDKISQFQKVDSLYFGYLGNVSIPMEDGTVVLALGESKRLVQVNQRGELVTQIARPGRGPGEVQDVLFVQQGPDGGLLAVDQINQKIIRFGPDLELLTELTPKTSSSDVITGVYPTEREGLYILRSSSGAYLFDKDKSPAMMLKKFSADEGFKQTITVRTRPVALMMHKGRPSGARVVPYSPSQQIAYRPETQTLYSYWTGSSHIAELSADFDTLNTIAVDLPSQNLSDAEYDSLEKDIRDRQWKTVSEELPETKTPVERMLVDHRGRFWLQLNYRGNSRQWVIMDQEGRFQKIVHLPRGSRLTHISEHHLGVRLNDITFALFEAVE